MISCECKAPHEKRRVVLTGGPGAGKTATLEIFRQSFCQHVLILPEAASILFGGGFPRQDNDAVRRAGQRAIFFTQRELEAAGDASDAALVLCDRGTVDGSAYWPGPGGLWENVSTTLEAQLGRYDAVIHLRTPPATGGYDRTNPLRIETALEASEIDARIERAWAGHPRRTIIEASADFLGKVSLAFDALRHELPECCRSHTIPGASAGPRVNFL